MTILWSTFRDYVSPLLAALVGGYFFTWGLASLVIAASVFSGGDFHSAEHGAFLLAFPVCLFMFFWLFLSQKKWLAYGCGFGGGALMTITALVLQAQLTAVGG